MGTTTSDELQAFRAALYACFGRRRDALFELVEGLLTTADAATPTSVARLSLAPSHRRGWGSAYAALRRGEVDEDALRALLAWHFARGASRPANAPAYGYEFAVDVSAWPRRGATTSPERGYWYHHGGHSGPQRLPITEGWAYQWVARVGVLDSTRSSWTAPVDVRRVRPAEAPVEAAVAQLRDLIPLVATPPSTPPQAAPEVEVPLFSFDAGYDSAYLSAALADLPADAPAALLVRLRRHRCFFAPPAGSPAPTGGHPARPARGVRGVRGVRLRARDVPTFRCGDPSTWPAPATTLRRTDPEYGRVEVRAWAGLYAPLRRPPRPGFTSALRTAGPKRGPRRFVRGTVLRVQVQRLHGRHGRPGPTGRPRPPRRTWTGAPAPDALWLWWSGPGCDAPTAQALDRCWRAYARRYDLEQTFRFLKQRLAWTTPRLRLPEQADRWSWLVAAAFAQLLLARTAVADRRLPWERVLPPQRLTPARVLRAFVAFARLLPRVAVTPRPCGSSPGRPKGRRSRPAPRYPPLKKAA